MLQGGMEIPCTYTFKGKNKLLDKLKNMEPVKLVTSISEYISKEVHSLGGQ